ncbi:hypothetical protein [Rhizobium paknamense]|uniref:Uncharacterized protein n=1 Tax=Rhizobium paknamense TaxID=1206817 RepID=A0ABU0IJC2_9HYPH|nr:hypothetical protein [Rhizobium paknamense]MDQ0458353.1 hypothetical protein [Rhizobium paknamense]
MGNTKGGAFVVVGPRESRAQGEGKQEDDGIATTEKWSVDTDHQTDKVWVVGIQRKLYQWSKANPDDKWCDMWGWLTDLRVLRHAWQRVASNKGGRTAGVDGMTVGRIRNRSEHRFLVELQADLRSGVYGGPITAKRPKPVAKATGWRQRRAPGTVIAQQDAVCFCRCATQTTSWF